MTCHAGWRYAKIGSVCQVVGGGTPPTSNPEYWNGPIAWLTPKDLSIQSGRYISRGERSITNAGLAKSSAKLVPKGSVLLTTRAPVGYLAIADAPVSTNQGFRSLVPDNHTDNVFLFYLLKHNVPYLKSHSTGTTFGELSGSILKSLSFAFPPISEQKSIASLLATFDDKIELNRRMNETLEETARTIFKDWFVDFGPTRAKAEGREPYLAPEIWDLFPGALSNESKPAPIGWSFETLVKLAAVNPESWPKGNVPEKIEYVDLSNTKQGAIETTQKFLSKKAPSRAKRILRLGDTIVGMVRPGNKSFAFVGESGLTGSTGFAVLRPRESHHAELVYFFATAPENIERLSNMADGAAYPAVRPEVVGASEISFPNEEAVLIAFSALVSPMVHRVEANKRENRVLAKIRDLLLPKLISGEIRLVVAKKAVGNVS